MNLLFFPLAILTLAAVVSCNFGTQYRSVVVNPGPIHSYQPAVSKTYTTYERQVKVPVVETSVPVSTSHVSYEKSSVLSTGQRNGGIKSGQTSVVVPVETGQKTFQQYVPAQTRYGSYAPIQSRYQSSYRSPVQTKVNVETTYKSSDVPVHTGYRSEQYVPAADIRSVEVPVRTSVPVGVSVKSVEVPVQTSYRSVHVPVQTTYRSVHTPIVTGYRSVYSPIQTSYRSVYTPVHASYGYVHPAPLQYGQKSIHSPSLVGIRY